MFNSCSCVKKAPSESEFLGIFGFHYQRPSKNSQYPDWFILYAAQRHAGDDVFRQKQVHDDQRQGRHRKSEINSAVLRLVNIAAEQTDHDRQRVLLLVCQQDQRCKQVVPARYEAEDRLRRDGRLHDRQRDLVEDPELSGSVDPGRLYDFHERAPDHVLPHEENHGRRCDGRQDQHGELVGHVDLVDHLVETDHRDLRRDHHDRHDEREIRPLELPVIDDEAVGRQRREIGREQRRADRDDQRVHEADGRLEALAQKDLQVVREVRRRDERDRVLLDLCRRPCGVYDHDHKRHEH